MTTVKSFKLSISTGNIVTLLSINGHVFFFRAINGLCYWSDRVHVSRWNQAHLFISRSGPTCGCLLGQLKSSAGRGGPLCMAREGGWTGPSLEAKNTNIRLRLYESDINSGILEERTSANVSSSYHAWMQSHLLYSCRW